MTDKFIQPAPDCKVRFPDGRVLPDEGAHVLIDSYWQRRLNDGDVVVETLPVGGSGENADGDTYGSGENADGDAYGSGENADAAAPETPAAKKG